MFCFLLGGGLSKSPKKGEIKCFPIFFPPWGCGLQCSVPNRFSLSTLFEGAVGREIKENCPFSPTHPGPQGLSLPIFFDILLNISLNILINISLNISLNIPTHPGLQGLSIPIFWNILLNISLNIFSHSSRSLRPVFTDIFYIFNNQHSIFNIQYSIINIQYSIFSPTHPGRQGLSLLIYCSLFTLFASCQISLSLNQGSSYWKCIFVY